MVEPNSLGFGATVRPEAFLSRLARRLLNSRGVTGVERFLTGRLSSGFR